MRERSPEAHPIARLPGWVTAMNSLRSARMVSGAHCSVRGVRKTDVLGTDAAIDFDLDGREAAPDELGRSRGALSIVQAMKVRRRGESNARTPRERCARG